MDDSRSETRAERSDRNWGELVQELRVAQTGVQVLAGFLLTLPFTARFGDLDGPHRLTYLVAFSLAVLTVCLLTAPVVLHRFLFARGAKDVLVVAGARFAALGLATMGLTLVAVVDLIFGVVVGSGAGHVAAALALLVYAGVWVALPTALLRRAERA
ncbi:hypothetical protein ASG49_08375 [Marmoricola sp. Leaf446]|uniref:DUF6328 family protein n=1 Tax=Marmoricola sp. Leaf446 TaxID=1736379 RepID=UPI0006FE547B|nr:DUF6328 family protein [Marmoricola sp. Leaf446]KQT91995.1 hypothetical protein ASG49_08375 [Marmoricola sp. Leaf446]